MHKIIQTEKAPAAVGPYSQAIACNNMLFVSGQIPLDRQTGNLVEADIKRQTAQVMDNLMAIISEAGFSIDSIVKCTCYLQNMGDFPLFNETYAAYFTTCTPARECVEVSKLPKGSLVEISAICVK